MDRHTDLNFGMVVKWKDIYVRFVGQGHRSKVKVKRSKNVQWDILLIFESLPKKKLRNATGRNMTGVFSKCICFLTYNCVLH